MNSTNMVGPSDTELADAIIESLGPRIYYGATMQTAELRALIGLSEDSTPAHLRWLSVCGLLKDKLLKERQMYMRSVGSGSYAIVMPEEQAQVAAEDEVNAIRRAINKASSVTDHTNVDMLGSEQLRRHDDIAADRAARAEMFRRELRRRLRLDSQR